MSDTDRRLVDRIAAGDEVAFAEVYDQYAALVNGIAARLVGRAAAADITQEVFVGLWTRPRSFDASKGSLRTFLAVLARRRAIDSMRRTGREAVKQEAMTHHVPTVVPDIDEAAIAMVMSERVRNAVLELPPDQRRAIELAYFEGMTFRDVALHTGVPEGTAKSRLRLALARLEQAMQGSAQWA